MRILIFRSGAFGDVIITTPLVRYLANQGHELTYVTSGRGMQVLKNNPHIKNLIQHKEDTPLEKLSEYIDYLNRKYKAEKTIDLSESIEVALSLHPRGPEYKLPKQEKLARFNRNFYEYTFEHAFQGTDLMPKDHLDLRPELFFEESELKEARKYLKEGCFNILLGMSGSGNNKAWPYNTDLCEKIVNHYPDSHIITVGDERCQLIEPEIHGRTTNLSGKVSMRTSMAMTSMVDLVIAPDTGLIHAAGCYDTPKICLLGHNTKECITKHFTNDFSVEADQKAAPCSPCLSLIYDIKMQCPLDITTGAVFCMGKGISMFSVYKKVAEVVKLKKGS